ncbi:MAG: CHAT domain-containing tetratricopeptide repeat protein [Pseudomonadota bacterium]
MLRCLCVTLVLWIATTQYTSAQTNPSALETGFARVFRAINEQDFETARSLLPDLQRMTEQGQLLPDLDDVTQFGALADIYFTIGEQDAALVMWQKAMAAVERTGTWSSKEAQYVRYNYASLLALLDLTDQALTIAQALWADQKANGQHITAAGLDTGILIGQAHLKRAEYIEAEQIFRELTATAERHDPKGDRLQTAANGLANTLTDMGQFDDALRYTRLASGLDTRFNDPNGENGLYARLRLALALERAGEFDEAQAVGAPVLERAQQILPPDHEITQWARRVLEKVARAQGRLLDANRYNSGIVQNALNSDDPVLRFNALESAAKGELARSNFDAYENLLGQALRLANQNAEIPRHRVGQVMVQVSKYLVDFRGDLHGAHPILTRAILVLSSELGPAHPETLRAHVERLYAKRIEIQTEALWRRAKREPVFWDGTEADKIPTEAELNLFKLLLRAERAEDTAVSAIKAMTTAVNYVGFLLDADKFEDAFAVLQGELDILAADKAAGKPRHLEQEYQVIQTFGRAYMRAGAYEKAVEVLENGTDAVLDFLKSAQWLQFSNSADLIYLAGQLYGQNYASAVWKAAHRESLTDRKSFVGKAFEAVQMAGYGPASAAVARATLRSKVQTPHMQQFVQDWQQTTLLARTGDQDALGRMEALRTALNTEFAPYSDLLITPPLSLIEVQQTLLQDDEAMIAILPATAQAGEAGGINGLVIAITQRDAAMIEIPLAWSELTFDILNLHRSLDPGSAEQVAMLRAPLSAVQGDQHNRRAAQFDLSGARRLYDAFFGAPEIAAIIGDKQTWTIVPYGETLGIPYAALVIDGADELGGTAQDLRAARWLGHERALQIMPSVTSLKSLRTRQANIDKNGARLAYFGLGDPAFRGEHGALPAVDTVMLRSAASRAYEVQDLPRLAGTRREVTTLATLFADENTRILLGVDANETNVRALADDGILGNADILHFATHGLLRGSFEGLSEPALALTPNLSNPDDASDGLLTASEAAQLSISADWVILSACDTAGGDSLIGSGLGGLVQGFFAAGARNLLVSHWRVDDQAAETLITKTVATSKAGLDKAEALRKAMKDLANDPSRDNSRLPNSHPSIWAPFVLIGSG